jgi:hypothetical protein
VAGHPVQTGLALAATTFVFVFGFALLGSYLRDRLPAAHLSKESQDVVRLGMGLVATMTALLLGLVTASARTTYDVQDTAIKTSAINILTLDRHLARLGEQARPTRLSLRAAVEYRLATTWPASGTARGFATAMPTTAVEDIQNQLLLLEADTESKRFFKIEALKLSEELLKTRWRLLEAGSGIPRGFLAVIIFWLAVTFASFGLYAPRNATVLSVLFVAAVSVALALFLISELDGPFNGVIRISPAPFESALENLTK